MQHLIMMIDFQLHTGINFASIQLLENEFGHEIIGSLHRREHFQKYFCLHRNKVYAVVRILSCSSVE